MAALGCTKVWCVHSRALQLAVGPPRPVLGRAIRHILRVAPPSRGGSGGACSEGSARRQSPWLPGASEREGPALVSERRDLDGKWGQA